MSPDLGRKNRASPSDSDGGNRDGSGSGADVGVHRYSFPKKKKRKVITRSYLENERVKQAGHEDSWEGVA